MQRTTGRSITEADEVDRLRVSRLLAVPEGWRGLQRGLRRRSPPIPSAVRMSGSSVALCSSPLQRTYASVLEKVELGPLGPGVVHERARVRALRVRGISWRVPTTPASRLTLGAQVSSHAGHAKPMHHKVYEAPRRTRERQGVASSAVARGAGGNSPDVRRLLPSGEPIPGADRLAG